MKRAISLLGAMSLFLAACGQIGTTFTSKDGRTGLAKTYKVSKAKESKIQFRMLDAVNALRGASSLPPVETECQPERRGSNPFARHVHPEPPMAFRF